MYKEIENQSRVVEIKRGDIFYVDLGEVIGSEQRGIRPCVIIQNNIGNEKAPTVIISVITSRLNKAKLPTHAEIQGFANCLKMDSVILLEQIRTIDKSRLRQKIGRCSDEVIDKLDDALSVSIGLHKKVEIFDLSKVQTIVNSIYGLEKFLNDYGHIEEINTEDIFGSIARQRQQLVNYCGKFNKRIDLFYTSKLKESVWGVRGENILGGAVCI